MGGFFLLLNGSNRIFPTFKKSHKNGHHITSSRILQEVAQLFQPLKQKEPQKKPLYNKYY